MKNVFVNAEKPVKMIHNFWNHIHFHPTDAIEDVWGQRILDSAAADRAARMVRIYAMLEDIVSENENGELVYDFSDTDKRIDYLVSRGFKLLICMNFLPNAIAKDKKIVSKLARYKNKHLFTSVPSDYRLWQVVCANYVAHLIERYGEPLVTSWYFHCWNEPNSRAFWMSDCEEWTTLTDEYLKLYDFFAEGIKGVCTKIRIGGPSAAFLPTKLPDAPKTDEYGPLVDAIFIKKFLTHVKSGKNHANGKIGTAFDFYSVHTYGYLTESINRNTLDHTFCTNMLKNYRRMADDCGFPGIEMISDEWEISGGGFAGTSTYPFLEYRNGEILSAHYFAFVEDIIKKDIPLSVLMICLSGQHNLPGDFVGTRTFATRSGFKTPIYNAYALSAMLGESILESKSDEKIGVIPTRCENGDIAVAIFNYSKNLLKTNGTLNTRLTVKLPDGKYTVTHYRLDKENCNSYTAWKELGRPEHCSQNEAEIVNQAGMLKPWYEDEVFEGTDFSLDMQLPDYAVSLLKFTKR